MARRVCKRKRIERGLTSRANDEKEHVEITGNGCGV